VVGGCRRLQNEELHTVYASPNITRINKFIRWAGDVACTGEMRNACKILVRIALD